MDPIKLATRPIIKTCRIKFKNLEVAKLLNKYSICVMDVTHKYTCCVMLVTECRKVDR